MGPMRTSTFQYYAVTIDKIFKNKLQKQLIQNMKKLRDGAYNWIYNDVNSPKKKPRIIITIINLPNTPRQSWRPRGGFSLCSLDNSNPSKFNLHERSAFPVSRIRSCSSVSPWSHSKVNGSTISVSPKLTAYTQCRKSPSDAVKSKGKPRKQNKIFVKERLCEGGIFENK